MSNQFAEDILKGLTSQPKYLDSKYFYNKQGDQLFQKIMQLPAYYLTDSEFEIFSFQKDKILQYFQSGTEQFNLIEFGAGDGFKTKVLLSYFLEQKSSFHYSPIDISQNALDNLTSDLLKQFPELRITGIRNDYFHALEKLNQHQQERNVILFLGSNIGNFKKDGASDFLKALRKYLKEGDILLIGFDLKKNPDTILQAYNDSSGVTKAFNLNLLQRINDELDANFDLTTFKHYPTYNPDTGETRSYLISTQKQNIELLDTTIEFEAWEPIYMELSKKFDQAEIYDLAQQSGFQVIENLFDCKHYFTDSLWQAV
ncbi:L-histidine N(alpha)-methyltransferase [Rapidithrix thailandica]|uniref:L-histidine N(Alpha)-methyltransferase n=1 Tax=Rapidithrix thailandica TaxID=413964 RepID=A0AAW9SEE9_9BACT